MDDFLSIRYELIRAYNYRKTFFDTIFKFIAGLIVFTMATSFSHLGFFSAKRILVVFFAAVLTTVASPAVFLALAGIVFSASVFFSSIEAGILVFIFCFLLFLFYGRIFAKESLIFVAMLVLYKLRLPYLVPLAAGLYIGPAAIVPVCAAFFAHSFGYMITEIIELMPYADFSTSKMLDSFMAIGKYTYEGIISHTGWMAAAFTLTAAMLIIWIISRTFVDMEKEKALVIGLLVMTIGLIISSLLAKAQLGNMGIIGLIPSALISAILAYIITVFDCVKDYQNAEKVQFQDDDYVYYVKAVPKIVPRKRYYDEEYEDEYQE